MAQEEHSRHRIRPRLFAEAELSNSKSRGRRRPLFGVLRLLASLLLLPLCFCHFLAIRRPPLEANLVMVTCRVWSKIGKFWLTLEFQTDHCLFVWTSGPYTQILKTEQSKVPVLPRQSELSRAELSWASRQSGLLQSQRFDMMGKKCSLITASPTKLLTDRHAIASILCIEKTHWKTLHTNLLGSRYFELWLGFLIGMIPICS